MIIVYYKTTDLHISLTYTVNKILEHIISCHIMEHLENNHILYELQYGFQILLISLINDLTKSYDAGQQSYVDIAKAFDTIPHNRLKLKLSMVWYHRNYLSVDLIFSRNASSKSDY